MAAERMGLTVDRSTPGLPRVWTRSRPCGARLGAEQLYTAVPAGMVEKTGRGFDKAWTRVVGPEGQLGVPVQEIGS